MWAHLHVIEVVKSYHHLGEIIYGPQVKLPGL